MNILNFTHHKLKLLVVAIMLVLGLSFVVVAPVDAAEESAIKKNLCGGAGLSLSSTECKPASSCVEWADEAKTECKVYKDESSLNKLIASIVNILTVIVGIVAVIMIIWGGFKYITSSGDSGSISSAKNTIIYAIIGLIIVALAQVIVRFVLNKTT